MGQGASVQRKGTVRIIGDAQLAAVGAVFQVWTPVELRSILDVFSALTGGTCICSRSRFISEFTCLFGLDESTRSNVFTFFDVNKDGYVDFEEFVRGLTVCQRGRPEEKMRFIFDMYSWNGIMRAEDVARLLVDASGSGAVAAQWKELRGLSAKRKGQEQQLPIVYLNEDADAQTRAIRGVKLRVQELMETSRVSTAAALEADSASLESDDEYDNTEVPFNAPWAAEGKEIERPSAVPPLPISTNTNFQQRTTTILSPKLEQSIEFSAFSSWCVGGDVPYGELLRRLNPIPSRSEEAGTVISLAQTACRRGLVEGSVWCVLSNRWWQSWLDYTGRYEDILLALGPVSNESQSRFASTAHAHAALGTPSTTRRISQRLSTLTKFTQVMPEVGRVIQSTSVFAGAEAVAGSGKRASRVQVPSFSSSRSDASPVPFDSVSGRRRVTGTPLQSAGLPRPRTSSPRRDSIVTTPLFPPEELPSHTPTTVSDSCSVSTVPSTPAPGTGEKRLLPRVTSFAAPSARPGPIDNTDLSASSSSPDLVRLDAVEGEDFVLLPDAVYTQLAAWYGGGPCFPRFVVDLSAVSEGRAGGAVTHHTEVDVWPVPITVCFAGEGFETSLPPLPRFHTRLSTQKPWVEVISSLAEVHKRLFVREPAEYGPYTWPRSTPIAQAALATIRTMCIDDYRLHVQSVVKAEMLHYRIDTRDTMDTIDHSFLVGGETLVLERRFEDNQSPLSGDASANIISVRQSGWSLSNVKGPQLWTEIEVGDLLDVDIGQQCWRSGIVMQINDEPLLIQLGLLEDSLSAPIVCWVDMDHLAPFRTKSQGAARPLTAKKQLPQYPVDPKALLSAARKLSSVAVPYTTPAAAVEEDSPDPGAAEPAQDMPAARRRTYRSEVTFKRPSVIALSACVQGCRGLKNLGNTCFMASIIQCLNSASGLTQYFLSSEFEKDLNTTNVLGLGGRLAVEYFKLLCDIWSARDAIVNPRRFKVAVQKFAPQFSGHNQHDCQEFLAFLLDGLHEDLNRVLKKPYVEGVDSTGKDDAADARQAWARHLLRDQSVVVDLFQGQLKSSLQCQNRSCGHTSTTFDPFMYLQLPLPSDVHRNVTVTFVPLRTSDPFACEALETIALAPQLPKILRLQVHRKAKMQDLIAVAAEAVGVSPDCIIASDVYKNKIYKTFAVTKSLSGVRDSDTVVLHEIDPAATVLIEVFQAYARPPRPDAPVTSSGVTRGPTRVSCNLPFVLSCSHAMTNSAVLSAIEVNLSEWLANIPKQPAVDLGGDGEEPTRRSPHYSVVVVNSRVGGCGVCGKGQQCTGCVLPDTDDAIVLADNTALCVEWTSVAWTRIRNLVLTAPVFVDDDGNTGETPISLASLFDEYSKQERLSEEDSWYCPGCKSHQQAVKRMQLWAAPHILVLQLKRFSFTATYKEKIHRPVEFPLEGLDLSPWTLSNDPPSCDGVAAAEVVYQSTNRRGSSVGVERKRGDDEDANPAAPRSRTPEGGEGARRPQLLYDLFAVSNHLGSMGAGHYTTIAQSSADGYWYEFDDERVTRVNPASAISPTDAYLLFFKRRVGPKSTA